jgi:serine phosphatase RsbU (regulator of sigma subunit)
VPGETSCGDAHLVQDHRDGVLVAVLDGLGHGEAAAEAARQAAETLERSNRHSAISMIRACHEALIGTRGVVISLAMLNVAEDTMTWLGVGNVTGVLLRADDQVVPKQEVVLVRAGIVGLRLPVLRASVVPLHRDDLLVFATDGIRPSFVRSLAATGTTQEMADRILAGYRQPTDDALVLVARYKGRGEQP